MGLSTHRVFLERALPAQDPVLQGRLHALPGKRQGLLRDRIYRKALDGFIGEQGFHIEPTCFRRVIICKRFTGYPLAKNR